MLAFTMRSANRQRSCRNNLNIQAKFAPFIFSRYILELASDVLQVRFETGTLQSANSPTRLKILAQNLNMGSQGAALRAPIAWGIGGI